MIPAPKFDFYRSMFTLRETPVTEAWIENLAAEFVDWAMNDPEALILDDFYLSKGLQAQQISTWKKKHSCLAEAHAFAKRKIANRREKGALTKDLSETMVSRSMPLYSDEWKEVEEWRASLRNKKDENVHQGPQIVVIDRYPNSELVPEKPKEKE